MSSSVPALVWHEFRMNVSTVDSVHQCSSLSTDPITVQSPTNMNQYGCCIRFHQAPFSLYIVCSRQPGHAIHEHYLCLHCYSDINTQYTLNCTPPSLLSINVWISPSAELLKNLTLIWIAIIQSTVTKTTVYVHKFDMSLSLSLSNVECCKKKIPVYPCFGRLYKSYLEH